MPPFNPMAAVPGDVRILMPFVEGESVEYGGRLCFVSDVREDGHGGVQITLQKRG